MFAKYVATLLTLFLATTVSAADLGAATFSDLQARPTQGKIGIAFFTVTAAKNDSIIAVSSDCCDAVELHRNEKINGIMSMRRIAELSLKKNTPMRVQPDAKGGEHLMLIGLKQPLVEDKEVAVTFTFKKAGTQTVSFPILADKASAGTDSDHHH